MNKVDIAELLAGIAGKDNVRMDEPMKNHTSFKIGGPADVLVTPENAEQVEKVLKLCHAKAIPLFVMGNGTNLIVRDKGIRGVVVKIFSRLNQFSVKGEIIEAEAGLLLSRVSSIALEHELAGMEFASGIPGTLGGAVAMNAGAYGGEMKDIVIETEYLDEMDTVRHLHESEHQFGYRNSIIQKENGLVLKSWIRLKKGNADQIKERMEELKKKRKDKQPLEMPSAGSIFKRPEGYFTGKLIEDCGLKGYRIGGAEVSAKHCGFIVNAGGATAEDVIHLIHYIQEAVRSRFGVELETEVRIVGEE